MVIYEEIEIVKIYPQTYQQWLDFAEETLREMLHKDPYATPKLDATLLLQFVTQRDKSAFIAYPETELNAEQLAQLAALLVRRATGEPMAYILGQTDFWTLNLAVSKDTLIPRPDTEILVELAVKLLKQRQNSPHFDSEIRVLDLGTGTGAIALSIASELKKCGIKFKVFGVDLIENAVVLAKQNALHNGLSEVEFYQSAWFEKVSGKFDMIVSNPPYIDPQDPHLSQGDVRFEPLTALIAEEQGYADLRHIILHSQDYLKPEGYLLLEHGWQQGEKVRSILAENLWVDIATIKDYGDNERVSVAKLRD
ncbi:MAG: peptide chain release factor N(5)-glutamine methyltransferase [Lonepinella koalarum]|nr:peptide chain release factor N(5)-glutamine methyltransferase [Lonepinella koalarum]